MTAVIAGVGAALPERVVTNDDIAARVDTSDEWIVERTGIRERRAAGPGDTTASLGAAAGAAAIKDAGLIPDDIGLLMLATTTPDQALPATSPAVQDALGLRCGAFDVGAACSGFVYAFVTASALIDTGAFDNILVVGAEILTRIVDPDDRGTCILFGDGAGAAVVCRAADPGYGLLGADLGSDGSCAAILHVPMGGQYIEMDGGEVFRRAVRILVDSSARALADAGLTAADVDWFVPHQANRRIIEAAAARIGIPMEKTIVNLDRVGNTSAASIPLALTETPAQTGDVVLMSGFGAGMTWATAVVRWGAP